MTVLGVLVVMVFGALLTSCQQESAMGVSDHEKKVDEMHKAISQVYARFTYDTHENPCAVAIGQNQTENCFYVMTINQNLGNGVYQGKFSQRACMQNMKHGNPFELCDKDHWQPAMRQFKVNANPPLQSGKDYDLYSQPGSDVLTCHDPDTDKGKPTTTCVERTADLP